MKFYLVIATRMFYDKQCSIWGRNFEILDGRENEVKTQIYDLIPCDFYTSSSLSAQYEQSDEAREMSQGKYEVVLPGEYTQVKKGMHIELIDLESQGVYLIDSVLIHRLPSGKIDNLTLSVHLTENV